MADETTQLTPVRIFTGDNPFQVDPEADYLSPPPDIPEWSETMYFAAWSPEEGVGVWTHMGVVPEDKTLWWAQVFALLPDGVVLADRSFGRPKSNRGPETGNFKVECTEPGRRWRLRFDGAGEISSTEAIAAGSVGAGIAAPFSFELELDAVVPVYDIHAAVRGEVDWKVGAVHHEQGFAMSGQLTALGRSWDLNGSAVRDHSLGVRDFGAYGPRAHVWHYVVWPDQRRAVGAFTQWLPKTSEVTSAVFVITEGDRTEVGGDLRVTGAERRGAHPRDQEISLVRADGSQLDLTGQVVHNITVTYAEPNHNINGNVEAPGHGLVNQLVADETTGRWTWPGGEIGYGNCELMFRPSDLPSVGHPLQPGSRLAG